MIKAGSKFRFASHYHPYGEETFDRQRVGIKFYPKGVVPKYVVTSHRIRTGVGNDWVMNREAIEDLMLRAGAKLDIDEPVMPTGRDRAGEPAPRRRVSEHSAQHGGQARAVLAAAAAGAHHQLPAAHALPRHADDARSDPSGRSPRDPDRRDALRAELADHLQVQGAAPVPGRDHPPHDVVARQHDQQPAQPRPDLVAGLGQPDHGRDGPRLDRHRLPDREQYQEELAKRRVQRTSTNQQQ